MKKPYSIKIFVPDGDPNGLRTIEKSLWNGFGIVIPRVLLGSAKQRPEMSRAGVYILAGPPENSGLSSIYIGEGDPIGPRLCLHAARKPFWTSCFTFTSTSDSLNKVHVQFIEARLVSLAKSAKQCLLKNRNTPTLPSISAADAAEAEGFLQEMLLCFPLLGFAAFSGPEQATPLGELLILRGHGIVAKGQETSGGFLVKAGSGAVQGETPTCHRYLRAVRSVLQVNGVLTLKGGGLVFSQDYLFSSPSNAAGTILGRSINGRLAWKTATGVPLKVLQEKDLRPE